MDGPAHVIALNEWQMISVMRVVPRVKFSLVPLWTRLVFYTEKFIFSLYSNESGGEESGLQQDSEFTGN